MSKLKQMIDVEVYGNTQPILLVITNLFRSNKIIALKILKIGDPK